MIKSINRLAPFILILLIGCKNKVHENNSVNTGYLQSKPYKKYIASNDDKERAAYSTKRMFMLLEEEMFLYSSDYDFYAIYSIIQKDTIDFFILKSKDSIPCLIHKRIDSSGYFLYLNKDSNMEKERYNLKTNVGLVDQKTIDSSSKIFKKVLELEAKGEKTNPDYEDPVKTLFLYDGNEYYLIGNYSLNRMNEIDSFFKQSTREY
ncbi:MAG: hypothetical protein EOO20_12705 [Chryseobacterium sp.]|nr:MAG: hypothetical protein EOO20_12705 [Chryseobacterium sp.]